jgi:hypothetical protein
MSIFAYFGKIHELRMPRSAGEGDVMSGKLGVIPA